MRERGDGFFHRQTDNIGERAVDFCDDFLAATLRGIGACFVERIDLRKIIVDFGIAEPAKTKPRNLVKGCRPAGSLLVNKNRGTHLVSASAQTR